MNLTIHATLLPHDDPPPPPRPPAARRPGRIAGLLPRHARLRGPQRRRVRRDALDHRRPAGPARHVDRPLPAGGHARHHGRRAPHHRRDDGQGHLRQHQPGHPRPRRHVRARAGRRRRGRPGADRPAVRRARLRLPGPLGQPRPHPGAALSMATSPDTQSPAQHAADSHDLIRVYGARENNLKDISIEIPKRRLTVFTGVSGSGKSSLVFDTIAAESQRLINETYSAFVQGFMPTLARPEVDVLDGLTTAISVDQERMGANPRSTVGTAADADAMLRILFSRLGQPHIGGPGAYSFNVASVHGSGGITVERGNKTQTKKATFNRLGGMCPNCEGRGAVSDFDLSALYDESKSLNEGALTIPGYSMDGWYGRIFRGCGFFDPDKPIRKFNKRQLQDLLYKEPTKIKVDGVNLTYAGLIPTIQRSMLSKDVDAMQPHIRAFV